MARRIGYAGMFRPEQIRVIEAQTSIMMEVRLRFIAALLATAEALQRAPPVGNRVIVRRCAPPFAIAAGSALPAVGIELMVTENLAAAAGVSAAELDGGASSISLPLAEAVGKAPTLLVGMPGTRTCTELQLPRLVEKVKQLSAEGVESVGVLTSKDRYKDATWKRAVKKVAGSKSVVAFLADSGAKAAKALGLADGTRCKRFALVIDNGVVAHVATDDDGAEVNLASNAPPGAVPLLICCIACAVVQYRRRRDNKHPSRPAEVARCQDKDGAGEGSLRHLGHGLRRPERTHRPRSGALCVPLPVLADLM